MLLLSYIHNFTANNYTQRTVKYTKTYIHNFVHLLFHSLHSHCTHTLAWSKVIFLRCAGGLEHSLLRNQDIQHHLILQIIT